MARFHTTLFAASWLAITACASAQNTAAPIDPPDVRFGSAVLSADAVEREEADWGTFLKYFEGASWGTDNVLSGVAQIKPGREIHPPHTHGEEEYLMVTKGTGIWSLNGETFEANAGDMLYAAPWDEHGIRNTGDTVLEFVFWKWTSSGITPPAEPGE